MRQLTGLDASFLFMEDERIVGHTSGLMVLDPSTAERPIDVRTIREFIGARIHLIPPFRWRLVDIPMGIDLPYWVDEGEPDLDYHIRSVALPGPGTDRQLADLVAGLAARRLDRSRPLWELFVIEGMPDGRVGILTKMHHAAVDGKASVKVLTTVVSTDPAAPHPPPPDRPLVRERPPSGLELLGRGWMGALSKPQESVRLMTELAREATGAAGQLVRGGVDVRSPLDLTGTAPPPRLPFNQSLTSRRNWAYGKLALADIKTVKDAYGFTLNDVVMALCAGALRRWLMDRNALPDKAIKAMVPISTRSENTSDSAGNEVSALVAVVPTHLADPRERLRAAHEAMAVAKEQFAAVPAATLQEFGRFMAPAAAEFAARTAASFRLTDRVPMPFNLVISNVPGPRQPLYYAGGLIEGIYPVSMIADGMGLNITVQSYRDDLAFGLVGTPELVPDIQSIIDHLHESLAELLP